jgi:anti-anti-sigma regulatory factor
VRRQSRQRRLGHTTSWFHRNRDSRLVVDLSGVTFCDASGLAVLVGVARRVWVSEPL